MGSVAGNLKNYALAGLFALSGLAATAQIAPAAQKIPPKEKIRELKNTEFLFLIKSYHTDRSIPFNEWNPGLIVKQQLMPHLSAEVGTYKNSNYRRSDIAGFTLEANPINVIPKAMNVQFGLTMGLARYPKARLPDKVTTTYYAIPPDGKIPANEKKRGQTIMRYIDNELDSTCNCVHTDRYIEVVTDINARGVKEKKLTGAIFPTFKLNFLGNNGIFIMGAYGPGLGQGSRWGGVFASGVSLSPYDWYNDRQLYPH